MPAANCLASFLEDAQAGEFPVNTSKDDPEFDPFAHGNGKKGRGASAGPAWLALLLALGVAGYNGYQWWVDYQRQAEEPTLQQSVSRIQAGQSALQESLQSLESRVALAEQSGADAELATLRADFQSLQAQLAAEGQQSSGLQAQLDATQAALMLLQQRLDAQESGLAALAERADAPDKRLDIAEIGYLLRLAAERLELFGDVRSAGQALALADAHLLALDDPLYLPVHRRIAESRQALQALPMPDIPATSARLTELQNSIPGLRFAGDARPEAAVATGEVTGVWQRIKSALAPLVTVRRRVDEQSMLSLEDRDFLRQGLWLQLETARLALMRSDAATWERSLVLARDTLASRFDAGSAQVRQAREELERLLALELQIATPDISAAFAQLRLLTAGQAAPPSREEPDDAGASAEVAEDVPTGTDGG